MQPSVSRELYYPGVKGCKITYSPGSRWFDRVKLSDRVSS